MKESGLTASPVAKRLYYDSAELTFSAQVADIQLVGSEQNEAGTKEQVWRVALDRTAFYPESGGQPWDTGVLIATARSGAVLEVPVERVEEDAAGEVWHFVRKPLVQGTEVEGRVDAARRRDHTQQHSGQHLLSAVFEELASARTVSFHLGAETSTIDLQLRDGTSELSREALLAAETRVNELVFEDRRVTARWHTRDEAEAMLARGELRKLPERSGPMRVLEIAGVEWNACGGTHVASTGAIGGVLLRRTEKVKQGVRVEFVCGLRAVAAARRDWEWLSSAAGVLGVGSRDVSSRITLLQAENSAAGKQQRTLLEELAETKAAELLREMAGAAAVRALFKEKPPVFGKRVAVAIAKAGRVGLVASTEGGNGTVNLALPKDDARHAGNLIRDVGPKLGLRGGGSAEVAQGVCEAGQASAVLAALLEEDQ